MKAGGTGLARLKLGWMKARSVSAALMAAGLIVGVQHSAGQTQTETVKVDFSNPALAPSHWTLTIHPDGSGHFTSYGGEMPGGNSDMKSPPVNRDVHLSQAFADQVFQTAYRHKLFKEKCESNLKVAFQGEKTLSYDGPKGDGACTFNYSKDRDIQALGESMIAVEQTIMEGARLELLLKHDPLGLDEEMNFLVQAAKDGRAQQICAIKGILVQLANDPNVLDGVRKRADLLLQDPKI
ncbi:MAG TPA: hypothetical protein VGR47_15535 [Terracidiphilus sp.]|nr:hypothetical protein [Terracidiphilus sp.]